MSGSPDGGTPIEALETGNVTNTADASRMAQILQDMNASGAEVAANPVISSAPPPPPPPQMMPQQMPQFQMPPQAANSMTGQIPMMVQQQQQQQQIPSNFVPYEDESAAYNGVPKKNMWSNILDRLVDPLLVAVLIFTLSLPVLQTFLSKHATWAFSLGGQLSWLGLIAKSIFGGLLFALIKMGASMAGL
jgi:hypothetical protein